MDLTSISKFLSYILRHHPESIGLQLDNNGWAQVSELIEKARKEGRSLNRNALEKVMQHGSKNRFIFSEDGNYIRAGYGHSIDVNLQMKSKAPPKELYHGTAQKNRKSILQDGIHSGSRNFVHLSATRDDAKHVGSRHGEPVILIVKAREMSRRGHDFYQSESEPDIWLTKKVPAAYVVNHSDGG